MRTAYDAIASLSPNIPTNAQVVMGYVPPSGFAWSAADWARFPGSVHVRITPSASATGLGIHMLDVERGDATPGQAPGWAAAQRRLGQIPSVYCSASIWQSVQEAFNSAGVAHPEYVVAAYPGTGLNLPTLNGITAVGHQYESTPLYDLSVLADYWPGVDEGGDMNLTDVLPDPASVAGTNTVAEALTVLLGGIAGKRTAGAMAVEDAQIDEDVKAGFAQIAASLTAGPGGNVDVQKLAAALAPLLPADATPAQIGESVAEAFAAHLAATVPAATPPAAP